MKFLYNVFINTPFKIPKLRFYIGKIKHGSPIFYPRVWVKSKTKKGYYECKNTKWFNFQIIRLGYKTKWTEWDFRFEWNPQISIVFCHLQFCVWIVSKYQDQYWENWLTFQKVKKLNPKMKVIDQVKLARKINPQIWRSNGERIDYWNLVLKSHIKVKLENYD